jgi:hypothetical protein
MEREAALLSATLMEERRELFKASFWNAIQMIYPDTWMDHYSEEFHQPICDEIQNIRRGEDLWLILFREARKSFLLTILRTIWRIVKDPNIRILLIGAREETVKPFARLILSAFVPGTPGFEGFQALFPDYLLAEKGRHLRQAFQFTHPLRTKTYADPTFRAAYLGVTGAGWRCDEMVFDDCIERRNVSTPEQASKAMRNMLDLFPLLDLNSPYRNILGAGTRWSYLDPYGRIIGEGSTEEMSIEDAKEALLDRKIKVMIRHALEVPGSTCSQCPTHVVAAYPHGEFAMDDEKAVPPSFPVHTRDMILGRFEEYKLDPDKGESLFYHQYGNICLSPRDQKFQREWFRTATYPCFQVNKRRVLAIDSADKDFALETGGDYMVALFGEFDDYGRLLLNYGLRSNAWTRKIFLNHIITWCKSTGWWPNIVVKEKVGEGGQYLTDIGKAFAEYQQTPRLKPVTRAGAGQNVAKKMDHIVEALQAPLENGEIVFGSHFPPEILHRALEEGIKLGQVRHDDVVDTLSLFMAKGVRLEAVPQHGDAPEIPQPPELGLYDPDAQPGVVFDPGPLSPTQQAINAPRLQAFADELPPMREHQREKWTVPKLDVTLDW